MTVDTADLPERVPQGLLIGGTWRDASEALSGAIRAVSGVVDLAPTLAGRALRAGEDLVGHRPAAGQGIDLQWEGSTATVAVDIAAVASHPTVATAGRVQQAVRSVLAAHRMECASVTVSVLALHP